MDELFGFTIIDRDGGDVYTSEAEYPTYKEAEREAKHMLCDLNQGSFEIWLDQED
jgi:hypothetical protein